MLCENCGARPANIHFHQVVNGRAEERHLCSHQRSIQVARDEAKRLSHDTITTEHLRIRSDPPLPSRLKTAQSPHRRLYLCRADRGG